MAELGTPTTPPSDDIAWHHTVVLDSTDLAPALARAWVRDRLGEHGLMALADDTTLLVSELVTNVWRHAPNSPKALVEMTYYNGCLSAVVSNEKASDSVPRIGNDTDDGGRGLELVAGFAADWGTATSLATTSVWFTLTSSCEA